MEEAVKTTPDDADDNGVNRIGALPDEILSYILSFLPTRESAATSVLSTRWRYLFISRPDIDLEFHDRNVKLKGNYHDPFKLFSDFISFANRLILLRNGVPLRKFKLSVLWVVERFPLPLDSLISAALELCQLQELEIFVNEEKSNYIARLSPEGIFTCKTLTCLRIEWQGVELNVPHSVCLPNLKELCLVGPTLVHDGSVQRLILGCPLIQEVVLRCGLGHLEYSYADDACIQIEIRDISSPCLKKLVLSFIGILRTAIAVESKNLESLEYGVFGGVGHKISINAPNIKYLACRGGVNGANFIRHLKFLVRTEIGLLYGNLSSQNVFKLLNEVKSVESLCLEDLSLAGPDTSSFELPTFSNLISLEFKGSINYFYVGRLRSWKIIPSLIKSSPNLEKLVFDGMPWAFRAKKESVLLFREVFPKCSIEHLKEIEFTKFSESECEFKLVEYLLQNGKALKKMMLGGSIKPSGWERIMSYQRCSEDCRIMVEKYGSINS
ncbi:hypothetical protein ACH5RR_020807 [Cinchona calisaya]|uniref:F-box domain-containing protein n=1 Tax=Cinchona calisaya TaxID=153742 RepID=A0ABD2ZFL9_9GENT